MHLRLVAPATVSTNTHDGVVAINISAGATTPPSDDLLEVLYSDHTVVLHGQTAGYAIERGPVLVSVIVTGAAAILRSY